MRIIARQDSAFHKLVYMLEFVDILNLLVVVIILIVHDTSNFMGFYGKKKRCLVSCTFSTGVVNVKIQYLFVRIKELALSRSELC